jgi:hypothetical protein
MTSKSLKGFAGASANCKISMTVSSHPTMFDVKLNEIFFVRSSVFCSTRKKEENVRFDI